MQLALPTNTSKYRKQGEPCTDLRHLVDKTSRAAKNSLLKAAAKCADTLFYKGPCDGRETKVAVMILEYYQPASSAGGGSGPPTEYERPVLTLVSTGKKHMKVIGNVYKQIATRTPSNKYSYVPLLPDSNENDWRIEPQLNTLLDIDTNDRFQPPKTARPIDGVQNDRSFENSIVEDSS